jgi:peptidoglycan hydrolase CwlO-like protein
MKNLIQASVVIVLFFAFVSCQNSSDQPKENKELTQTKQEEAIENTQMAIDELEGELDKINDELEDIMLEMEKEMEYEAEAEMDTLT